MTVSSKKPSTSKKPKIMTCTINKDPEVAQQFVRIYYKVAHHNPKKLSTMYVRDATLLHDKISAHSSEKIRDIARKLPIAFHRARMMSVTSKFAADGDVIVIVIGALPKNRVFSQLFLLSRIEEQGNSFRCREDVFTLFSKHVAKATSRLLPADLYSKSRVKHKA